MQVEPYVCSTRRRSRRADFGSRRWFAHATPPRAAQKQGLLLLRNTDFAPFHKRAYVITVDYLVFYICIIA